MARVNDGLALQKNSYPKIEEYGKNCIMLENEVSVKRDRSDVSFFAAGRNDEAYCTINLKNKLPKNMAHTCLLRFASTPSSCCLGSSRSRFFVLSLISWFFFWLRADFAGNVCLSMSKKMWQSGSNSSYHVHCNKLYMLMLLVTQLSKQQLVRAKIINVKAKVLYYSSCMTGISKIFAIVRNLKNGIVAPSEVVSSQPSNFWLQTIFFFISCSPAKTEQKFFKTCQKNDASIAYEC